MGKLGGEELNYSSDVDLIYVLEADPSGTAARARDAGERRPLGAAPIEYYTRVAHEFGRLVSEPTRDGFLYRIDLDLRPEGQAGPAGRAERRCWRTTTTPGRRPGRRRRS